MIGLRAEDAQAFCEWLTQQYGGNGIAFRLPTLEEASQLSASDSQLASWCAAGSKFQLTKLEAAREQRFKEQLVSTVGSTRLPFPLKCLAVSDHDFALALTRDLALTPNFALVLAHNLSINRDLADDAALASNLALGLARALDLAFARDHDLAYRMVRDLAYGVVRELAVRRDNCDLPTYFDFDPAFARLRDFKDVIDSLVSAKILLAARQAYRKFTIRLMEYAYIGYEDIKKFDRPSLWERLSRRHRDWAFLEDSKQTVLELYWWWQMMQAREAGKLPAWEGIRIVREQVPPAESLQ